MRSERENSTTKTDTFDIRKQKLRALRSNFTFIGKRKISQCDRKREKEREGELVSHNSTDTTIMRIYIVTNWS